jgi:hypothetical protein
MYLNTDTVTDSQYRQCSHATHSVTSLLWRHVLFFFWCIITLIFDQKKTLPVPDKSDKIYLQDVTLS